jgi:phage-related protein
MTTEPRIYTKNYVNGSDVFTVSSGSTAAARLYDGDRSAYWQSSGENSDIVQASVQVDFYDGGVATNRAIDTLILLGINIKNIHFQYWDGSAWQNAFVDFDQTAANVVTSFTPVSPTKIRLLMLTTISANQEKQIGELIVCKSSITPSVEMSTYEVAHREKAFELMLADGSIHRTVVKNSLNRVDKYEARVAFEYLSATELAQFLALKQTGQAFTWQPELTTRPEEVYQVNWFGPFKYKYVSSYKGAGFHLDMDLREV